METNVKKIPHVEFWKIINGWLLCFDLRPGPKNAIPRWSTGMASNRKKSCGWIKAYNMRQGEGATDAPEESDLWTAWQLFPLDDD